MNIKTTPVIAVKKLRAIWSLEAAVDLQNTMSGKKPLVQLSIFEQHEKNLEDAKEFPLFRKHIV